MIIVALLLMVRSAAGAQPPSPDAKDTDNYVKIEVKGDLFVEPNYRYDPKPDLKADKSLGATISTGTLAATFQLLAEKREHYELLKANGDMKGTKKLVVSGELVSVVLPYLASQPPPSLPTKHIIRIRDIRLAEPK
jgi:hypothetical protein